MPSFSFNAFVAQVQSAEAHLQAGRWRAAFDTYASTLRQRFTEVSWRTASLTDDDLAVLERFADVAVPLGEVDAADGLYAVVAGSADPADCYRRVQATVKRVHIALGSERFGDALQLAATLVGDLGPLRDVECSEAGVIRWERDRPWARGSAAALEAQIYLTLGRLLAGGGQYADASTFLRRGLFHSEQGTSRLALQARVPLILALAAAALERGAVAEAEGFLATCEPEADRPADSIRVHELRAGAEVLRGRFDAAVAEISVAVDECRRLNFVDAAAALLLTRAKLWLVTNRAREAEADVLEAAGVSGGRSARLLDRGCRLLAYARARQETLFGGLALAGGAAAQQMDASAAAPERAPTDKPSLLTARPTDFLGYYEERELEVFTAASDPAPGERGRALLEAIVDDFGGTDSAYIQARLELLHGVLDVQAGLWDAAQFRCSSAADTFASLDLPADEYVARRLTGLCLEHLRVNADTLRRVRARTQDLLATLTASMTSETRDSYLVNKWSVREAELADYVTRLRDERGRLAGLSRMHRWWASALLTARVTALHQSLIDEDETPRDTRMTAPSVLGAWWQLLCHPRDHQSVAFKVLPNGVVRVVRRFARCDLDWLPTPRARVRALVCDFHAAVVAGGPESERRAEYLSADLSQSLGLPDLVSGLPRRVRRLTIVPDDQLHIYPFSALPTTESEIVADRFAVTVGVPRAKLRDRSPRRRLVTVAAARGSGRDALPAAAAQVSWLRSWWQGRRRTPIVLADGACDAPALIAALETSEVVHFAGHGQFDPNAPAASGLVVDSPDGTPSLVGLERLASIDARGLRLATLLSCWSADSFLFPGNWAVSIPSSLCRAGAECVIAPLWEIDDATSTGFLNAACEGFASGAIDEHLRRALIQARGEGRGQAASILCWAPVQVYCAASQPFPPRTHSWLR